MSVYDIDGPGVGSVVGKVGGYVAGEGGKGDGGLVKQLSDFGDHVGDAGTAAASQPIGAALKEYVEHTRPGLKGMVTKTASCIEGAVKAVKAYNHADYEMVQEAQRQAANAPAPKIGK
ncbi:hypothetical protein AGRA3207_005473 [Actinomadura graeca]|uniref:ESX-1 secretion-associated protein n=1 Tax=Actinomadura graeca TaxID=2750812 RepID=A0ABX8R004_9ACTN|nr:DUF6507 family protein [Actinomadura graeca]QXJ24198.1 hypothetical protein AGRA3207_005473 [Actinomadura graeca]